MGGPGSRGALAAPIANDDEQQDAFDQNEDQDRPPEDVREQHVDRAGEVGSGAKRALSKRTSARGDGGGQERERKQPASMARHGPGRPPGGPPPPQSLTPPSPPSPKQTAPPPDPFPSPL